MISRLSLPLLIGTVGSPAAYGRIEMYGRILRHAVNRTASPHLNSWCLGRFYSTQRIKTSKPLRVIFCGSDDFSSASLRALHAEQQRNPELIKSIDVLVRPGKPSGRSLKKIRDVPIKAVAKELGLTIHERDTFTGWNLPRPEDEPINIIIAVSFGLFVPPRILKSAEYGGLNVHPSLLPNFRGPAPLQHLILSGSNEMTGVTLQTLDYKSFDHGTILAQTEQPGLPIPRENNCTYSELLDFITPKAAELLVQGIRDRVFVPPLTDVGWYKPKILSHAPKITSDDKQINWEAGTASTVERQYRAFGRLWTNLHVDWATSRRFIFEDLEVVPIPDTLQKWHVRHENLNGPKTGGLNEGEKGDLRFLVHDTKSLPRFFIVDGDAIIVACANPNGQALKVRRVTVEGKKTQTASKAFEELKEWNEWWVQKSKAGFTLRAKKVPPSEKYPVDDGEEKIIGL